MPMLKIIRQRIGINRAKKENEKAIPSMIQKTKNTTSVKPKLISAETFLEKRKRYFGTLILVIIPEFASNEPIPPFVESVKYEKTILPQNR